MAPDLAARLAPEDLLQETLLEAARQGRAFEPQGPAAFYRCSSASRASRSWRPTGAGTRSSARRRRRCGTIPRSPQTSPSAGSGADERDGRLRTAVARLPERQAQACDSANLEAATLAETAAALECSEAAVKALVTRGLAELAAHLDLAGLLSATFAPRAAMYREDGPAPDA